MYLSEMVKKLLTIGPFWPVSEDFFIEMIIAISFSSHLQLTVLRRRFYLTGQSLRAALRLVRFPNPLALPRASESENLTTLR